jgi:hypothetical protein
MAVTKATTKILNDILNELRFLRNEISLFTPNENLKDYSNPKKILDSYEKARAKYPSSFL